MAKNGSKQKEKKKVTTLTHDKAKRRNIPTAEFQSVMRVEEQSPIRLAYERRNRDLDPQLVWRGKDEQDWSDLVVHAPPLYIQEKVQPKVLIDDLQRRTEANAVSNESQIDLFADFNGLPNEAAKTEFYQHDAHWSNRMILGDSLQVMASLAEREGLRGQVQCIYIDPPYGIKFNSNFQWSTTNRDVKDGNVEHITREPEQVKAFRDTWREGVHSYLTYLRDRLTVARDLLAESGSIFVQIGDENVHRVRAVMDEVFGDHNFLSEIVFQKTGGFAPSGVSNICDYILWFAKNREVTKTRPVYESSPRPSLGDPYYVFLESPDFHIRRMTTPEREGLEALPPDVRIYRLGPLQSDGASSSVQEFKCRNFTFRPALNSHWKTTITGLERMAKADRFVFTKTGIHHKLYWENWPAKRRDNLWLDTQSGGFNESKTYVVQTNTKVVDRCVLMATDPGDLVLDPTCGSGTTATVAEQWGRRWITIDTSRVALALARARIMGARYPFYLLADSREGQVKEGEVTRSAPSSQPVHGNLRHGFVYQRVPHITLKSIANNAEIDVLWEDWQAKLEPLRQSLNTSLAKTWQEWEIPRVADEQWSQEAKDMHASWWKERIARQKAIDASIAAKAEFEYLYDSPYEDNKKVRVAGPFTVESLSPHRVVVVDENGDFVNGQPQSKTGRKDEADFVQMILENLKTAGVQQAHKEDKISFSSIAPWPGYFVCAEGKYLEGTGKGSEKRAAIFIGPEFGTVARPDLVAAAREAGDAGFDVLITCAFNYDAHSSEFNKLGRIPVLKARMNADLHMSDELKNTGKGNLFVIFGEPDIDIISLKSSEIEVKVKGVDVFHPNTGEVRSDGAEGIACWFIDTDYNEESFFVRHAYFLGANDPYKALKTSLKAEINEEAWSTLHSETSRPFTKPTSGRIAVKVINHLGDEVMKVFRV
jgi:adenine-specific DNA-methyltransferase